MLASRSLSLHQVSSTSARLYGANSPSHIPHTLYHALAGSEVFGPSLAQTCALSRITGYRLEDWMEVLGIDLGRVAEIEAALPLKRTRLLEPLNNRSAFRTGGPSGWTGVRPVHSVFPLGQLLQWSNDVPEKVTEHRSLFAKIGSEDAFAWPELLPGSIVRVALQPHSNIAPDHGDPPLRLIEHERGLWCGRFHVSDDGAIHAAAADLAYAQSVFRVPLEARIVGVVDLEIRWLHRFEWPKVPRAFSRYQAPKPLNRSATGFGNLVRQARVRAGLTIEEASLLSQEIAKHLDRAQYAIAQSTLSEYEAQDAPPRHLEKVVTLCLIYGIRLGDLVAASETAQVDPSRLSMPPHLISGLPPDEEHEERQNSSLVQPGTASALPKNLGEVPWFLAGSIERISGIQHLSIRDFYCLSGDQPFLPAHTRGSMLALVDRRRKKPHRLPNQPGWQQPAWILIDRDGEHRCACCSLEGENLVLYPESDRARSPEVLLPGRDVEVVGQIVAVMRRIPPRPTCFPPDLPPENSAS
ncbi:MAG: helix-turn-helix transcriptional regulator [Acidobacteriaceae bacterium]